MITIEPDNWKQAHVTPHIRSWAPPPTTSALASDEIHVWRVDLSSTTLRCVKSLRHILAEDERKKADGFCFEEDRKRFTITRGLLRVFLGHYLNLEPGQLRFCYGSHGKPALAKGSGGDMLRFNMSHSRGLVLLALTCGRELGIDVEYIRYDLKIWEIAARYFSPLEAATLRSLPINMQTEAFFAGWARKEAYIKARGEGLSLALNQFSVSLTPGEPAVLLNTLRSARGRPLDSTGAEAWLWLRGRPGR